MADHEEFRRITEQRYKSSFENHLGAKFLCYSEGRCEVTLDIKEHHLNIGRTAHGGVINSLCDIAMSGAVTCCFSEGAEKVVTLEMKVNFLRPGLPGDTLTTWGEVIKQGRTICYVEGGIKNQKGDLIAKASGNWFVKR